MPSLDETSDQLTNSNALSLKLTANPLLADRVRHLTKNTCARAFSAGDPEARKCAHGALFMLYQAWLSAIRAGAEPVPPSALCGKRLY